MGIFPMIQPPRTETVRTLPLYREAAWDFERGQPIFQQGNPVYVTGKDAIKVWIWKAIITERTRYEIYSWNFGCEIETLIGQNYTGELKQAEARRYVQEALSINPYIVSVSDMTVEFDGGKLTIGALVGTIYGEVKINV